jgi:hypothetical protein
MQLEVDTVTAPLADAKDIHIAELMVQVAESEVRLLRTQIMYLPHAHNEAMQAANAAKANLQAMLALNATPPIDAPAV